MKYEIGFFNNQLKDLREEYLMLEQGNVSEKARIRNEIAALRKNKSHE